MWWGKYAKRWSYGGNARGIKHQCKLYHLPFSRPKLCPKRGSSCSSSNSEVPPPLHDPLSYSSPPVTVFFLLNILCQLKQSCATSGLWTNVQSNVWIVHITFKSPQKYLERILLHLCCLLEGTDHIQPPQRFTCGQRCWLVPRWSPSYCCPSPVGARGGSEHWGGGQRAAADG